MKLRKPAAWLLIGGACGLAVLSTLGAAPEDGEVVVQGSSKLWHRVVLDCGGPMTDEKASPNPFTDYRLQATFTHGSSGTSYQVPGYYAADGDAAESSADSGKVWRVHFRPDAIGEWSYQLSFRKGKDVAVAADPNAGESAGFMDGKSGKFVVLETDKKLPDFRAAGRLQYVGAHHLQFAGNKKWFMKCGTDAPENLLAYDDIDATPNVKNRRKSWSPHAGDPDPEDLDQFTWQKGKGSELIKAIDYLAEKGLNAFSFLTFSLDGDDDNIFPHLLIKGVKDYESAQNDKRWAGNKVHHDRFDVSKLDQWDRIYRFGSSRGLFLHFKTQETENNNRMDGGKLGRERKLYYRELIARFGDHLALNWNVGEENTNSTAVRKEIAAWFAANDPYRHPVVIHSYPDKKQQMYPALLGAASEYQGVSLQTNKPDFRLVFSDTLEWVTKSAAAGKKWVVACDEPGDAQHALRPDKDAGKSHIDGRRNALWGHALAGGAGVEWYFGYRHADSDLTCQSFRSRDQFWDICRHFLNYWELSGAPFWNMVNRNSLISGAGDNANRCLAQEGKHYVVQLYEGDRQSDGGVTLDLSKAQGDFKVQWYDPRQGGQLQQGSVTEVKGGSVVNLGKAPDSGDKDWIVDVAQAE